MRRTILLVILLCAVSKYALDYLLSPEFQTFGDVHKAQWTCNVNNVFGGLYEIGSEYQKALDLYERTLNRCPGTSMAEFALFHKAACLENVVRPYDAMATYQLYLDTYPEGPKRPNALRALDRMRLAR